MVVPIYNGGEGSYFRKERLKIMGAVGSYQLWKKDSQAMRESGKLFCWKEVRVLRGRQPLGLSREGEFKQRPIK